MYHPVCPLLRGGGVMAETRPSFPHYARDWYIATRGLSAAARGAFIDFMSVSWIQGGVPADPDELRKIACMERAEWRRVWPELEAKWPVGADGLRRNPKLEDVRREADVYHAAKQAAGQKGGKASAESRAKAKQTASTASSTASILLQANVNPALALASATTTDTKSVSVVAREPDRDWGPSPTTKRKAHCAYESAIGLDVPQFLHDEFAAKLRNVGVDDSALRAWYRTTEDAYAGRDVGENAPTFWRKRFEEWRGATPKAKSTADDNYWATVDYTPSKFRKKDGAA